MRTALGLLLAAVVAGCGRDKEFAEAAIAKAEKEEAPVRDQALKLVPALVAVVDSDVAHARNQLERGDYRAAMKAAEAAEAKARSLRLDLETRRAELDRAYGVLAGRLPGELAALRARLDTLAKARRLPPGVDRAAVTRVDADYPALAAMWQEAADFFQSGDLAAAVGRARALAPKLAAARAALGPS